MPGFDKYLETKISLFIFNPVIRKHFELVLNHLGFSNMTVHDVPLVYIEAVGRAGPIIRGEDELIFLNLPLKTSHASQSKVTPKDVIVDELYLDIKSQVSSTTIDPLKYMSRTVPVLEVEDFIRPNLLEVLVK